MVNKAIMIRYRSVRLPQFMDYNQFINYRQDRKMEGRAEGKMDQNSLLKFNDKRNFERVRSPDNIASSASETLPKGNKVLVEIQCNRAKDFNKTWNFFTAVSLKEETAQSKSRVNIQSRRTHYWRVYQSSKRKRKQILASIETEKLKATKYLTINFGKQYLRTATNRIF